MPNVSSEVRPRLTQSAPWLAKGLRAFTSSGLAAACLVATAALAAPDGGAPAVAAATPAPPVAKTPVASSAPSGAGLGKRVVTLWPQTPGLPPPVTADLLELGGRVYRGACQGCHGEKGDGIGREGKYLQIPPRDFTTGQYIIRSTPLGTLPLDTDLFGSIRRGFRPNIGMPGFAFLSDREVWAVIAHIKTFSPRFKSEQPGKPVDLPPVPADLASMAGPGTAVFMGAGACFVCHGMQGKGDGPAAPGLVYVSGAHQGKKVPPANLHRVDTFKGGRRPEDIFRAISTGLDGTPMPGFAASLSVEQRWQLTAFILSLNPPAGTAGSPGAVQ
jgi:cytochrome c oxidase cbb3-type subunit 2